MVMLTRVGGLSKMTDNPAVADSVGSVDESLPALLSATAPMARRRLPAVLARHCGMRCVAQPGLWDVDRCCLRCFGC